MPTNNDYLSDIAEILRESGLSNNQLLRLIALAYSEANPLVKQAPITLLSEDATEADIWAKVNQIIVSLRDANVIE